MSGFSKYSAFNLLLKASLVGFVANGFIGLAFAEATQNGVATNSESVQLPDSIARQKFKQLSVEAVEEIKKEEKSAARFGFSTPQSMRRVAQPNTADSVQQFPTINVFTNIDPEDYVPEKNSPMLVFRATLDKQRPMTPKEITLAVLCKIKICAIDTTNEMSIADRNEAKSKSPPSFATLR